jgi:hypothetical protein
MTTTPNRTVKRCGCRRYRRRDNRRTEHLGGLAGGPSFAPRHGQRDNRRSRPAPLRSGSCRLATTQPRPIRCAQEPLAWPLATERRNRCVQEALACGDGQPGAPSTGEPNRVGDAGIAGTSRLSATDPGDSARGGNVSPERNRSRRFGARQEHLACRDTTFDYGMSDEMIKPAITDGTATIHAFRYRSHGPRFAFFSIRSSSDSRGVRFVSSKTRRA